MCAASAANVCLCPNGVPASGEACTVDGGDMCESCNTGFQLSADNTACDGMFARAHDGKDDAFAQWRTIMLAPLALFCVH